MTNLPIELFPERNDNHRIHHLYGDEIDDDTLNFWKRSVFNYCLQQRSFRFKPSDMIQDFTLEGVVPTSLSLCLQTNMKGKEVIVPSDMKSKSIGEQILDTTGWLLTNAIPYFNHNIPAEMICLSLLVKVQSIILNFLSGQPEIEHYLFYPSVTNNSQSTFSKLLSLIGKSLEQSDPFVCNFLDSLTPLDIKLLIDFMIKNKYIVSFPEHNIIKILISSASVINNSNIVIDIALLKLKRSVSTLEEKIISFEDMLTEEKSLAIKAKLQNNESKAIYHLKKRKLIMKSRDQSSNALLSLLVALDSVEGTQRNAMITEAYVSATLALKTSREKACLTPDTLELAISAFEDELTTYQDMSHALSSASASLTHEFTDEELEAELLALMATTTPSPNTSVAIPAAALSQVEPQLQPHRTSSVVETNKLIPTTNNSDFHSMNMDSLINALPDIPTHSNDIENIVIKYSDENNNSKESQRKIGILS